MARDEYRSYLLRLWRVEDDGRVWRVRLEDIQTGEWHGFASLEELVVFLQSLGDAGEQPGKEWPEESDAE